MTTGNTVGRMQPTAEQWQHAEREMESVYGSVHIQCDGFQLTLRNVQLKVRKFAIGFYVDGWFRGAWMLNDCEERRRFFRPVTRRLYGEKFIRSMIKIVGKKRAEAEWGRTITQYHSTWGSFSALKRHLLTHNQSVRITNIGGEDIPE